MKCSEDGCSSPAEYRYVWRWGDSGGCCAEHQANVRTRAGQLQTEIAFVAVPVPKDELSQAIIIIRDLASQLRLRIEEGISQNPATLRLGEDLARRVRNCPAPFGETMLAIREVGAALVAEAQATARDALHRERQAVDAGKELERVLVQSEQSLATERAQSMKTIEALRTSLQQAHSHIGDLEARLNDPDPDPVPAPETERPAPSFGAVDLPDLFHGEESKVE